MIFKPKISHQKPIKPPLKADFNAYFTKKRMIFTPIYKICATPKGPFRVRFPAGVPSKKEPTGSFLFGFRCGSEPAVRPIAQQWHERRATFGKPHAPICAKYSRRPPLLKKPTGSFLFGFRCGSGPVVRPIAQQWHEERSDEVFPAATSFKKAYGHLF